MQIIIWIVSSFVFSFINSLLAESIGIAFPWWVASFVVPSVLVSIYEVYLKKKYATPISENMKVCPNCGTIWSKECNYCKHCSSPLE